MKKLTPHDYHLRMVEFRWRNNVREQGIVVCDDGSKSVDVYVLVDSRTDQHGITYRHTGCLYSQLRLLRRFSDERMAQEILFKTPLAQLYERLKRGEVK